jgi:hypothetical protein
MGVVNCKIYKDFWGAAWPLEAKWPSGYPLQVLARSSLWAFHSYPWPMPARSLSAYL